MAVQLTSADLQYRYSRSAIPGDNPRLRGLDSNFFNGGEEYEVLDFINSFLKSHNINGNPLTKEHGLKIERMLQGKPGNLRSQEHVKQWVLDNWNKY